MGNQLQLETEIKTKEKIRIFVPRKSFEFIESKRLIYYIYKFKLISFCQVRFRYFSPRVLTESFDGNKDILNLDFLC